MVQLLTWTDEQYQTCKRMFSEGAPMSAIGVAIGKTRSAVGGFVSRAREGGDLAFAARTNKPLMANKATKPKGGTHQLNGAVAFVVARKMLKQKEEQQKRIRLRLIECQTVVTMAELQPHHCRFPLGDPRQSDFRYCGHYKVDGRPYCQPHCDAAFVEPKTRFR